MSIHVIPIADLREHDEHSDCWCGPEVQLVDHDWVLTHHALDGREHAEPDHDRDACPLCSSQRWDA